jgi:hypothetical protein
MPFKILLSTSVGWASVARLAHGFAAASCVVDAHAPGEAMLLASRYVKRRFAYHPLSPVASLRAAILGSRPDHVIACDDRAVAQMLKLYEESVGRDPYLADLIQRSLGEPASYPELVSRVGFMARAKALGVRVPETQAITGEDDLDRFIADFGTPLVVKSDGSWGGDGVVVARTREQARAAHRRLGRTPSRLRCLARAVLRRDSHHITGAFSRKPAVVSAQQFIAGKSAASAFACWRGEVIGAIYYDVLVSQGETGPPNVIRRVDCQQLEEATRKIARHYRLSGIHGMDFIRDDKGDVYLLEINPRPTQGSTIAFGPGRDLPAALISRFLPGAGMRPPVSSDTVAIFPREWQRDPSSPYLTSAHHDVPWDDPGVLLACLRAADTRRGRTAVSQHSPKHPSSAGGVARQPATA